MPLPKLAAVIAASACIAAATPGSANADLPTVPNGFRIDVVAQISNPRELVALPDGDLLVGTSSSNVYIVPNVESGTPGMPAVFATASDSLASGVAFSAKHKQIYIGTNGNVWATRYAAGKRHAGALHSIAKVRTGPVAPHGDGDVHKTTSVAFSDSSNILYIGVGSSCNSCIEVDPTRASILTLPNGRGSLHKIATRIRNAIAMTISPSGALWVGDAGQDDLPFGHPYEFLDNVTSHAPVADYGWPYCEENHTLYITTSPIECNSTVAPLAELPAYSTIIGAVFYPKTSAGKYSFPSAYRGVLFAAAHGSWHTYSNGYAAAPQVAAFSMNGDQPLVPVNWQNSSAQWSTFVGGFQKGLTRIGRPTGIAVGTEGSLFVADDQAGVIYRVRPTSTRHS
jgi:glucose/arabinose dehydrogenase